jgi:hypothetical protein
MGIDPYPKLGSLAFDTSKIRNCPALFGLFVGHE